MKKLFLILFLLTIFPLSAHAALTKAIEAIDAWALVAQGTTGIREGATVDVSPNYQSTLLIDVCLAEAAAETVGATIYVEMSSNTTGDADWEVLTTFGGPTGTAIKVDLGGDEAAGQTVLTVTDPTTANLDHPSKFLLLYETATPANSEIVFQVTNEGDGGDTITVLDPLTNNQTSANTDIYEIDNTTASVVGQYVVNIPDTACRVRVVYDNTRGTAVNVLTRARLSKITGI